MLPAVYRLIDMVLATRAQYLTPVCGNNINIE